MTNNNESNPLEIAFLSDQPLCPDKEQEMRFGHLSIADTLKDIILKCPNPFTIGLFGKWGVGKTSIINVLKEKLLSEDVATVIFDIWKHEGDALRRTFLKETTNQLKKEPKGLPDTFKLEDRLDFPITRVFQGGLKFNNQTKIILGAILLAVIIAGIIIGSIWNQALGTYLSIILGGGTVSTILIWLLQKGLTTETTSATKDRFQDPHEFESEFKKVISATKANRLLIVIDNLDRASHEKAVELLSTVKTFLEQERCIFLITCDAKAIEKHLENVYSANLKDKESKKAFDTDEFLRKFFNSYIRIPEFIDTEIQTYTEKMLEETHIPGFASFEVAYVIASAFRENPRQVKQFVNILASHFLLAQKREAQKPPLITPGTITNHVDFLAKYLIMKNFSPEDFQDVLEGKVTGDEKIDSFISSTKTVKVDNIRPFIYFKLSEEELTIPAIREIESALLYNDTTPVKDSIGLIFKDTEQFKDFNRHVLSLIKQYKGKGLSLYNIVNSLLLISNQLSIRLSTTFYYSVADLLNQESELAPYLNEFEPRVVFNDILQECDNKDRSHIIEFYIEYLGTTKINIKNQEYIKTLLMELLNNRTLLAHTDKQELITLFKGQFTSLDILYILKDKPEYQKEFLTTDTISKFVSEIAKNDIEETDILTRKTELLINFKGIISPKTFMEILAKLTELLTEDQPNLYREGKENLLNCVNDILSNLGDNPSKLTTEAIQAFMNAITQGINSIPDWTQKRIFLLPCLWIIQNFADPFKTDATNLVNQFFTNIDTTAMTYVFDKLNGNQIESLIQQYEPIFTMRSKQSPELFTFLYRFSPADIRTKWLIDLINTQSQQAIQILEQEELVIDNPNDIVRAMLQRAKQLPPEQREGFYRLCNKFKCAEDQNSINELVNQINTLLTQPNAQSQQAGLTALQGAEYISPLQKRDIATTVTNWLRSLPIDTAAQASSTRSVLVNWNHLPKQLKDDFLYFIFNNLIIHSPLIDNIKLGLNVLNEIKSKPNREDYPMYFDDIRTRLESEPDTNIKTELINILTILKPAKISDKDQEYWSVLEKSQ